MTTTDPKLIEPVAWMYEHHEFGRQIYAARYDADTGGTSDDWIGWTETPLCPAAAINEAVQNERAGIVAWLRAYDRDETNWPQFLANAIEAHKESQHG